MYLINKKSFIFLCLIVLAITIVGCGSEPQLDEIGSSESRSQNAQVSTEMQAQESQEPAAQEPAAQEQQTDQSSIDSTVIDISDEKPEISNDIQGQEFRVAITDIVEEELPVSGSFVEGDYQRDVLIVSPDEEVALMAGAVVSTGEGEENTVEIIVDDTTRIVHTAAETEWYVGDSDQLGAVLIELVEDISQCRSTRLQGLLDCLGPGCLSLRWVMNLQLNVLGGHVSIWMKEHSVYW